MSGQNTDPKYYSVYTHIGGGRNRDPEVLLSLGEGVPREPSRFLINRIEKLRQEDQKNPPKYYQKS